MDFCQWLLFEWCHRITTEYWFDGSHSHWLFVTELYIVSLPLTAFDWTHILSSCALFVTFDWWQHSYWSEQLKEFRLGWWIFTLDYFHHKVPGYIWVLGCAWCRHCSYVMVLLYDILRWLLCYPVAVAVLAGLAILLVMMCRSAGGDGKSISFIDSN